MKVCIGGTFNPLHRGHKTLIKKALETAGKKGLVFIGITSGDITKTKGEIKNFDQRKQNIEKYLIQEKISNKVKIEPIYDRFGPSIKGDFDAIVVSTETKKTAEEINKKRKKLGKKPLEIIEIPLVLAEDGKPISSTRIRNKEIDENGKLIRRD
ncbi:MAG: pantetheine-phosphate adenylyltransferase [Candidatus Thermoplasmatota archaeon]|nr:pantetheine-phosphate adenylyltransferase [Candidatus Thermoplasmatota archaeon]